MSGESAMADGRKRKMRPGLKLLLLIGVPVLALVISWMALDIATGWKLEAVLADIRARGWPTELADLYPAPIPDSENAAPLYRNAHAKAKWTSKDTYSLNSLESWAGLSAEQQAKVRADLAQSAEALELLHQAAQRPSCDFHLDYHRGYETVLPHLAPLRESAYLERAAIIVALADGRTEEAFSHWLDMVAMVRHQEGQKLPIPEFVRLSCLYFTCEALQAVIQNHKMSSDQVDSALSVLDGLENRESFGAALQGELVFFRDFARRGLYAVPGLDFSGGTTWKGDLKSGALKIRAMLTVKLYCSALGRPWRQYDEATGLSLFREGVELLQQPFYAVQGRLSQWRQRLATPSASAPLTRLLLPGFHPVGSTFAAAEARVACARTALALERYRLTHGDYPAALDALGPDLLPQVPVDPFDGKPLRYVNDGNRVAVYSVGDNLQDDGGSEEEAGPSRLYRDIVFTLRPGPKTEGKE